MATDLATDVKLGVTPTCSTYSYDILAKSLSHFQFL